MPALTLALDTASISEGAGAQATYGTITRSTNGSFSRALVVALSSSNTNAAIVPASATIAASQSSTRFPIAVNNNSLVDGPKSATLYAFATETSSTTVVGLGASTNIVVTDDDGPTLTLTIARKTVAEGLNPATTVAVSRNTPATNDLLVTLRSSDTNEATAPLSVMLTNGVTNLTFNIASVADGITDGSKLVTITASATNFTDGSVTFTITDINLPDLVIARITPPAAGFTEQSINIGFRVENHGLAASTNAFKQRVFISKDPYIGDDTLVGDFQFNGSIPPGLYFEQSIPYRLPRTAGDYWVVVTADIENSVAESDEDNNTLISATPLHVTGEYTATVQTDVTTLLTGAPVPLYGTVTTASGLSPEGRLVNIHITVREFKRVISALADATGHFTATFTPLPGEAGHYTIGAAHPGESSAPVQDEFTILGMKTDPANVTLRVVEGSSVVANVKIQNLSEMPLTGITATLSNVPSNLQVTANVSSTGNLAGLGELTLGFAVTANAASVPQATLNIRLTSAEGVRVDLPVTVNVESLRARLVANPEELVAGMARGRQRVVEFEIYNQGGVPTGPLNVLLPDAPWLHLASTNPMPSLASDTTNKVTLLLTPTNDMPLGPYAGNLVVRGSGVSLSVPFNFRALSEAKGDLKITAVDEYTYYAEGNPNLAEANVVVRDAITQSNVVTGVTDTNGEFFTAQLMEGYYQIEIIADKHSTYRNTHLVLAGQTNLEEAFLSRQTVRYIWTVVPTEIEDRTRFTIETIFETFVPAPVLSLDPLKIDLSEFPSGYGNFDLRISNRGLIALHDVTLVLPTFPGYVFRALVDRIGVLPANTSLTVPVSVMPTESQFTAISTCESPESPCTSAALPKLKADQEFPPVGPAEGAPCETLVIKSVIGKMCGRPINLGDLTVHSFYDPETREPDTSKECWFYPQPLHLQAEFAPTPCGRSLQQNCQYAYIQIRDACNGQPLVTDPPKGLRHNPCNPDNLCFNDDKPFYYNPDFIPGSSFDIQCGRDLKLRDAPSADPPVTSPPSDSCKRFVTFLVVITGDGEIVPLAGFKWGIGRRVNSNNESGRPRVWIECPIEVSCNEWVGKLNEAIQNSGFNTGAKTWKVVCEKDLNCCFPPPGQYYCEGFWECGAFKLKSVAGGIIEGCLRDPKCACDGGAGTTATSGATGSSGNTGGGSTVVGPGNVYQTVALCSPLATVAAKTQGQNERASPNFKNASVADERGVCARVLLRIEQESVIVRDAFNASLEIADATSSPLDDISVDVTVRDGSGQMQTGLFGIRPPTLIGLSAINGTGVIGANSTGRASWIIIPGQDAAPEIPTQYFVSGTLRYTQDGLQVTVPLAAAPITVYPNPRLFVDYFHQRDVFSDDPFTPEIEPSIPYSLAVMVQNQGKGVAKNMRITSGQPQIIDNEKGLLIDFNIIATEVAGQNITPSLTANFGSIDPDSIAIGRWLLTSTLQGFFKNYSATFEHIDGLGNPKLSLIESVDIHEMIHLVRDQRHGADNLQDFLVNDVPDIDDRPDTIYLSDGSIEPVSVVENGTPLGQPGAGNLEVQLVLGNAPAGWTYARLPDPADGHFRLVGVRRADGTNVLTDNFWTTDRTFIGQGRRPIRENILHLLDHDSTGSYTLIYALAVPPDTNAASSAVAVLPAQSGVQIPVTWSGADNAGGGGIASYDIYVSSNNVPFAPWLQGTALNGSIYNGVAGSTYAFYSIAIDAAGNRESAPPTPDAATTVTLSNSPPALTSIANQTIDEGTEWILAATAADADLPNDALTFSLLSAPPGVTLTKSSQTAAQLRWPTGEGNGPSTNLVRVRVRDNGVPLSAPRRGSPSSCAR